MITFIVPGIRPHNWHRIYDSITQSTKREFEIIFVGPYDLPESLKYFPNVSYIKDFGNPVRCQQLGLLRAKGDVVLPHADDAFFPPDALDVLLDKFYEVKDPKRAVAAKYLEGGTQDGAHDSYYRLNGSTWTASPNFQEDWWLGNLLFLYTDYTKEIGGWDCNFETTFYSHTDLAVRVQADGVTINMMDLVLTECEHMPGETGDHGPIHRAHVFHDHPLFLQMYSDPISLTREVRLDNWERAPEVWERRFKND